MLGRREHRRLVVEDLLERRAAVLERLGLELLAQILAEPRRLIEHLALGSALHGVLTHGVDRTVGPGEPSFVRPRGALSSSPQ